MLLFCYISLHFRSPGKIPAAAPIPHREPSGLWPWQGLVQGCSWRSGRGSLLEPGRISSLEPSPGGKGTSAAWRGGMDTSSCTRDLGEALAFGAPWVGWEEEEEGAGQRQPQIRLFQSLGITHRGVKGVRALQAVSAPLPGLAGRGCASCPSLSGEAPDTFTCLGTGEMRAGTVQPCLS